MRRLELFWKKLCTGAIGLVLSMIVPTAAPAALAAWTIGPIIAGRSYSPGMPDSTPDGSFEFPVYDGAPASSYRDIPSVHYVTRATGPIEGKSIRMRFEITGGGPFKSTELPDQLAPYVSLFIQRHGDNWSAVGEFEKYRWWSKASIALRPGHFVFEVPLRR